MISVTINGKRYEFRQAITVQTYLEQKGLAGRQLAIAVNGEVLRKEQYGSTLLSEGDRVEIVRPIGGGCCR